jgi:hypothetical protein
VTGIAAAHVAYELISSMVIIKEATGE